MKKLLFISLTMILLGSCSVKKKSTSKTDEKIREHVQATIETIKKETRNPGTNLLLGDRIIRDGEFYQPIDRTVKGSDNKSELRLIVDKDGLISVSLTVPTDTISETKSLTKTDLKTSVDSKEKSNTTVSGKVNIFWILISIAVILTALLLIAYKLRLI